MNGLGQSQFGTNWGNYIGADPGAAASYGVLNTTTGGMGGAANGGKKAGGSPSASQIGGLAGALGGSGGPQQGPPEMGQASGPSFAPMYRGSSNFQRRFGQPVQAITLPTILSALTGR